MWIDVKERLPESGVWCLATFENGFVNKIRYLERWGWSGELASNKVIAWMPLPAPYKPKESKRLELMRECAEVE